MTDPILTLRLKVKRESYAWLNSAASECNAVYNYCNETSVSAATRDDRKRKWLSGFDLCALTSGSSQYFSKIGADTVQRICNHYVQERVAAKRTKLRWRTSSGVRRSLGWVPFKAKNIKRSGRFIRFAGKTFRFFNTELLGGRQWRDGCFSQDAIGDWWLCLPVISDPPESQLSTRSVGIDLGIKSIATTSDGDTLEAGRWAHGLAAKLAALQRRAHRKQAKRIHRKIARRRQDAIHKFTRGIVSKYQNIIIGDVSSAKLAKTKMAKSVFDSGWGMLKMQLSHKGQRAGRCIQVVNESYTSRACSNCGCLSGPKGLDMLSVRFWTCSDCGESHSRDVNAAKNILSRAKILASVSGNEPPKGGMGIEGRGFGTLIPIHH